MADLTSKISGVEFKNPIIVGSATPTWDSKRIKRCITGGAAGAIAKSLFSDSAAIGRKYPRPRFKLFNYREYPDYPKKLPDSFTLRSLEECSSFGYEDYMRDVNDAKDLVKDDGIVIASLSGSTKEEWKTMCEMVNETKADWVELNNSCPFAADMGIKIGAGAVDLTKEFIHACSNVLKKPFSVKLTPQTSGSIYLAKLVEAEGASAVNLSARLSGIMLDIETASPIGWGSIGGYGGPYLLGYGLKTVFQISKEIKIPIIGGLGVWKWQDIVSYIMAGASIVQTVTGVMLKGFDITGKWVKCIEAWMDAKGYKSLGDIKGLALQNIKKTSEVEREYPGIQFAINRDLCNKCGVCKKSCMYEAISITKVGAVINDELCDRCGMCYEVCPERAVGINRT